MSRYLKKYMKYILSVLILLVVCNVTNAQNPLGVGKNQLNVGVGLSDWGIPVYIGLDHGIHRDFTIGAELSYRSYNENWKDASYRHNITGISGNVNYHFNHLLNIPKDFDLYAGANIGFYAWSSPDKYDGTHTSGLGLGGQ